ncbi:MAG: hypothetical protein WCC36_00635 [Gammaproteobacteria bacterium]
MDLTCRASTFDRHASLWLTPEYFPLDLVQEENKLMLVTVSERLYQQVNFLDDREIPTDGCVSLPLDQAIRLVKASPARGRPLHGIFHIAFCGSTLIARCLDRLPGAMVLKEPYLFHDLAFRKRHMAASEADRETWRRHFDLLVTLLARTFHAGQAAVMKPTDASTNLISDLLANSEDARALFLYVGLEEFLISMAGDELRRRFVRDRLADLAALFPGHTTFRNGLWRELSDARQAACLWWVHMRLYADFVRDNPQAGCRSLCFGEFLRDPMVGLSALARHFGIESSAHEIRAAIAPAGTHSKKPGTHFTSEDRVKKQRGIYRKYSKEIRSGIEWAERHFADCPIPAPSHLLPLETA